MAILMALGLLPIALGIILIGFFVGRAAKKRGKNPWLWGGLTVVVITVASWQQLPRWAGILYILEVSAIQTIAKETKMARSELPRPNEHVQFILSTDNYIYSFSLPAEYEAARPLENLVRLTCRYPTMAPSPRSRLGENNISIDITVGGENISRAQSFLKAVASHKAPANKYNDRFVGKKGEYDLFQSESSVTGEIVNKFVFTAKDGQLVLVEPSGFGHRVWRNIGPEIGISYSFFSEIGNDYRRIDEVVSDFLKARLVSNPVQSKGSP